MEINICPNYDTCQIINIDGLLPDSDMKKHYTDTFCTAKNEAWISCKRYQTKNKLNFCPDFVLPDSDLSIDEIIDKFEEQLTD
jgi:hypothetical protein